MSQVDRGLDEERLRARLDALRRGLARLEPATRAEYASLVAELEGQIPRIVEGRVPAGQFLSELEAIAKCVVLELELEQGDASEGPEGRCSDPAATRRRRDGPAALPVAHRSRRQPPRVRGASQDSPRGGPSRVK
jgi:hypothetical protein